MRDEALAAIAAARRPRRAQGGPAGARRRPGAARRWPTPRSARCRPPPGPRRASGSAPRAREVSERARRPAGRPGGRARPAGADRGGRRRHAAVGPPAARRPAPGDHGRRAAVRRVRRHGLRGRRGPRGRGRVVQLRRAQLPARPPGPGDAGHHVRGRARTAADAVRAWCCARTPRRCRSGPC